MPPTWFTPEQYIKAREYYWQKLEKENNLILRELADDQIISYFNRPKKQTNKCEYDILFHFEPGWDQWIWRSDRTNPKIIQEAIYFEEASRVVPILTSSNYGHRKTNLEGKTMFPHKRINQTKELYRNNGVNMKPSKGLPKDSNVSLS